MDEECENMDCEQFSFDEWCTRHGLTKRTKTALIKEALESPSDLKLLSKTDIREMSLPIGQRNLLVKAIKDFGDTTFGDTVVTDTLTSDAQVPPTTGTNREDVTSASTSAVKVTGVTFDAMVADMDKVGHMPSDLWASPAVPSPSRMPYTDPRSILTMKANCKTVHITDFLGERAKKRRQGRRKDVLLKCEGNTSVVLQCEDGHPYGGISLTEWSAANCRLMAHLLATGALARDHVEYYMAYTTQVYEYAERYDWEAVLEFDHSYRERQAQHGFMWGCIPPNMELNMVAYARGQALPNPANRKQVHPMAERAEPEQCRLFIARNGNCPHGAGCKFVHPDSRADKSLGPKNGAAPTQPLSA